MASIINKRQAARNERKLQDLIYNVPGNDRCADCAARNPGWASWSLGIFLCMRCAAIHRKLGTHISKVKSLSMDTWTSEQIDQMSRTGNVHSNQIYNPRKIKPNLPIDSDEVDTALEKFLRQKYQTKTLAAPEVRPVGRNDTGSTGSSDDRRPPVPAKDSPKFGTTFRSGSSPYKVAHPERPLSPIDESRGPGRPNGNVELNSQDDKLARLRSWGFSNEKRNFAVLQGVNGNMKRAVETLARLGEGGHGAETIRTLMLAAERSEISRPNSTVPSETASSASRTQAQRSFSQPLHPAQASPVDAWNPFGEANQQTSSQATSQNASYQNLAVPQQPLYAQNTGSSQSQVSNNPFMSSQSSLVLPSQHQDPTLPSQTPYQQPQYQQPQHQQPQYQQPQYQQVPTSSNPFLRQSLNQDFATPNSFPNQQQQHSYTDPYAGAAGSFNPHFAQIQQPHRSFSQPQFSQPNVDFSQSQQPGQQPFLHSPPLQSPPMHSPQSYFNEPASSFPFRPQPQQTQQPQQQPQQPHHPTQQPQQPPYFHQQQQTPQPFAPNTEQPFFPQQSQQQQQPLMPQQTGRYDKSSILALYNTPNLLLQQPQRSASTPLPMSTTPAEAANGIDITQSRNPFGYGNGLGHIREESHDFSASKNAGRGGRQHSPDAFASLSSAWGR